MPPAVLSSAQRTRTDAIHPDLSGSGVWRGKMKEGDPPPPSQKLGDGTGGPCLPWRTCTLTITMLQTGLLSPKTLKFQYTGQETLHFPSRQHRPPAAVGLPGLAVRDGVGTWDDSAIFCKVRCPPRPVSAPIRSVARNTLIAVCHGGRSLTGVVGRTASRLHPFDTGLS